jgi:hypothetical protein
MPALQPIVIFSKRALLAFSKRAGIRRIKSKNLVKPQNREAPRQSNKFAWHMSYPSTAILDIDHRKAPESIGAFSFRKKNLLVNPLLGRIWV